MEAKELRIGNYVLTGVGVEVVYELYNHKLAVSNGNTGSTVRYSEIEPIPITKDWLLKFGFEKVMKKHNYTTYKLDGIKVAIYPTFISVRNVPVDYKYFSHIHHLQNLYNSLTGKELKIKK